MVHETAALAFPVTPRCYSPIEMVAVAWTAIGLLAATLGTLVGAIFQLGSRIDAQGQDLRAAIDAQGRELRAAIDAQGSMLRAAIDAQSERIDAHLERHTG
jgi:hypothetical protein